MLLKDDPFYQSGKHEEQKFELNELLERIKKLFCNSIPIMLECFERRYSDSSIYSAALSFNFEIALFLKDLYNVIGKIV